MGHIILGSVMSRMSSYSRKMSSFSTKQTLFNSCVELDWQKNKDGFNSLSNFNIVSFNLLAPCYKRLVTRDKMTGYRNRESSKIDLWNTRAGELRKFLRQEVYSNTDIVAFQEFWLEEQYLSLFKEDLDEFGYEMHLLQRTGKKLDAVAFMIKKKSFEVLESKNVFLCNIGDRVALLLWLRHRTTKKNVLVANTHLSFPHSEFDKLNQMKQMKLLTNTIDQFARSNGVKNSTRVIMGDFNVESLSPVCDHLRGVGYFSCHEVTHGVDNKMVSTLVENNNNNNNNDNIFETRNDAMATTNTNEKTNTNVENMSTTLTTGTKLKTPQHQHKKTTHHNHSQQQEQQQHQQCAAFISHRTHNAEDLGVDHIFVKPAVYHHHYTSATTVNNNNNKANEISVVETVHDDENNNNNNNNNSFYSNKNNHNHHHLKKSKSTTTTTTSHNAVEKLQPKTQHTQSNINNNNYSISTTTTSIEERDFLCNGRVLPTTIPCDVWNEEFEKISDHRPVGATIVFARKKIN